jgi:cytochrome c oxidase subunit 2
MFGLFTVVFVTVVGLWLYALRRRSAVLDDEQARRITNRWIIGGGIILPVTSIVILLAVGLPAGFRMLPIPTDDTLTIQVVGHQWWWEVHYPESGVSTANELFLPVGRSVDVHLTSSDVIHSFWIPRLAGKLDVLPGRTNVLRLQASESGSFRAQCAEFCGWGHAHMVLPVEAQSPEQFDAWLRLRAEPVSIPDRYRDAARQFEQACGDCHRINGFTNGRDGPDLTSIGARPMLGGIRKRDNTAIFHWLRHHRAPEHQTTKGAEPIPDHRHIAREHHREIANWLETLGNE